MPRAPDYSFGTRIPGPVQPRRATPADFYEGGGQVASAIGRGLDATARHVEEWEKEKERRGLYEAQKAAVREQADVRMWFNEVRKNAANSSEDVDGFVSLVQKELQKRRESMIDQHQGSAKEWLDLRLGEVHNTLIDDSIRFESEMWGKRQRRELEELFDTNMNVVSTDPASVAHVLDSEEKMIQSAPYLDATARADLSRDRRQRLWGTAVQATVTKTVTDPNMKSGQIEAMLKRFQDKSNPWMANVDPQTYAHATLTLQKAHENLLRQEKADVESALSQKANTLVASSFDDSMDRYEATGEDDGNFTKEKIAALHLDEDKKIRLLKRREDADDYAKFKSSLEDTSLPGLRGLLEKYAEKGDLVSRDEKKVRFLERLVKKEEADWKRDPVQYVVDRNPALGLLKQAVDSGATVLTPWYAENLALSQKEVDPEATPRLVGAGDVDRVSQAMRNVATDGTGTADAMQVLRGETGRWGKFAPFAVEGLRDAGAINAGQAIVASNIDDKPARYRPFFEELLQASTQKPEDLGKLMPEGSRPEIRESLVTALKPLIRTLEGALDGNKVLGQYVEAGESFVMNRALRSGKMDKLSLQEAAQDFAQKSVLDHYQWRTGGNNRFRIPNGVDPGWVDSWLGSVWDHATRVDLALPGELRGLDERSAQESFRDSLRAFGRFVNTDDESGIRLVDEHGRQVYRKTGAPMMWTWPELSTFGSTSVTPPSKGDPMSLKQPGAIPRTPPPVSSGAGGRQA